MSAMEASEETTQLAEKQLWTYQVIDKHGNSLNSPKLALPASLLKGLYEINSVLHSKIQAASLSKIWARRNLLAQTHTYSY